MTNSKTDWEEILARLSKEDKTQQKRNSDLFPAFLAFNIVVALTAVLVMLGNMVINTAWPSIDALRPGIGYRDAWFGSSIFWVLSLIRIGLIGAIARAAANDSN